MPLVLSTPTENVLKNISEKFSSRWNLPHCVGSIDGKHIRIMAPPNSGSLFYNYKDFFSVVLMGVCDADYNFSYIDVGCYGSISDGGVFTSSVFGQMLQEDTLPLPEPENLPGTNTLMSYFFVGDSAFPLRKNLMRPYPGKMLNIVKGVFNYRLTRARRVIENTFGVLVARWRIFHRNICAAPDTIDKIVKATVVLHNFIRSHATAKQQYMPPNYVDHQDGEILGAWRNEVENSIVQTCTRVGWLALTMLQI